jgi:TRAP-type uncharacterized transport system substrate-binding protein
LYGNAGAGKSTLLRAGVLPLLRRRQSDCNFGHRSEAVATDHRKDNRIEQSAEVPIRFQSWNEDPLAALQKDILEAMPSGFAPAAWRFGSLCNGLSALSREFGLRFLIIFDHFEQYLSAPAERTSYIVFADQVAQAVNESSLRANFLISVRNEAASMLERFRAHVRGFDDASFRLEPFGRSAAQETEPQRVLEPLKQTSIGRALAAPSSENSPHTPAIEPFAFRAHGELNTISLIASAPVSTRDEQDEPRAILTATVSGQAGQDEFSGSARAELPGSADTALLVAPEVAGASLETAAIEGEVPRSLPASFSAGAGQTELADTAEVSSAVEAASSPARDTTLLMPAEIAAWPDEDTEPLPELQLNAGATHIELAIAGFTEPSQPLNGGPRALADVQPETQLELVVLPTEAAEIPSDNLRQQPGEYELSSSPPAQIPATVDGTVLLPPDLEPEMCPYDGLLPNERAEPLESADLKPGIQMDVAVLANELTGSPAVKPLYAPAGRPTTPTPITPVAASSAHRPRKKLLIGTMCAALLAVAGAAAYRANEKPLPSAAAMPVLQPAFSIVPRVATPTPNLPRIGFVTEPGNSTDALIASDISRIVGPAAGLELDMRSDMPFWQHEGKPALAIMRYETLQAARMNRTQTGEKLDELRVVAPLYTEEIYFIVRRDSPLTYIHELRGARLNLGPAQSNRALVVRRLHESMFAEPMETANSSFFSDNEALSALVTGKTIDAMVVVSAQPAKWLVDLPPHIARSLKLLRLDRTHSSSAKAIEVYLPAMVRAANYSTWLTEDIPTLATIAFLITTSYAEAPMVERLEKFTSSLCRNLPILRRDGHPKWREVQPDFEVDTAWPYSKAARAAFQSCVRESVAGNPVVPIVDQQRR